MAINNFKSDLTKVLMKEYSCDASSPPERGTLVYLSDANTVTSTKPADYSGPVFLVYTEAGYSRTAVAQVTVIYGGVVELETDNYDTNGSYSIGTAVYESNGQITSNDGGGANIQVGHVVAVGTDTITVRLSI